MKGKNIDNLINQRELGKYLDILPGFIHNLNTPIMNISGRVELIQYKNPEIKSAQSILSQIDKINHLVDSLRTFVETEKLTEPQQISIDDFLERFFMFLTFNVRFKHNINITKDIEANLNINSIPKYFFNLLYEIFNHSIQNIPNKGNIRIKVLQEDERILFEIIRDGEPFSQEDMTLASTNLDDIIAEETFSSLEVIIFLVNRLKGMFKVSNNSDQMTYLFSIHHMS